MACTGFRFGLEGEYLLADSGTFEPLWHPDLRFEPINAALESIEVEPLLDGLTLDGLELDPPHRRIMPYYVEGYGLADPGLTCFVDLLPKGVEIRTPVCTDLTQCLRIYEALYQAMLPALGQRGWSPVALSHHPRAWSFRGPQNHARHDWWHWGERAMTTYGPDLNISLPERLRAGFDWGRLVRRVNHYAPSMVIFSLASPVGQGQLHEVRGRVVRSVRTYRRSVLAPAAAYHPKEGARLEFKAFDMPADRGEFAWQFLLWLWLIVDEQAPGAADEQDLIYDLGEVARLGWGAGWLAERAGSMLERAELVLSALDVDPSPLALPRARLEQRTTPADTLIDRMTADPSIPALLRHLDAIGRRPPLIGPWTLDLDGPASNDTSHPTRAHRGERAVASRA